MKSACQIESRARSLAIFSRRAVLNVGMLLRDEGTVVTRVGRGTFVAPKDEDE